MNIYVFGYYVSENIKTVHRTSEWENSKAYCLLNKFKYQGAISLIKPLKGAVKLGLFNLLSRFDHLFMPFSFRMVIHRWLKPVHRDVRKRNPRLKNSSNRAPKKELRAPRGVVTCAHPRNNSSYAEDDVSPTWHCLLKFLAF